MARASVGLTAARSLSASPGARWPFAHGRWGVPLLLSRLRAQVGKFFERLGLHRLGGRRVLSSAMGVMYFALLAQRVRGPRFTSFLTATYFASLATGTSLPALIQTKPPFHLIE